MDPVLLAIVGALAVLALAVVLFARHGGSPELAGRLDQMAQSQAAAQAQLAERMQAQERALAKAVEERLAEFGKRVGDRLQEQTQEAGRSLGDLKERLAVIDAAQKNITELSSQVVGLQDLLASKQAQGAFGQIQMEDLVRDLLPRSGYEFQATLSNGKRVDCLIRLANPPGPIPVDAKFPLDSYRALREAQSDDALKQARRGFDDAVRKHVKDIAERYILPGETAESALLFLPSQAIYDELYANFRTVVEESFRRRVWIVAPTTMMALLTTIRAVLRDVQMREQAGRIQGEVRKMLENVARLDERAGKLQRHFEQAGEDLREIRISTEKVTRSAERIEEVRLEDDAALPPGEAASLE